MMSCTMFLVLVAQALRSSPSRLTLLSRIGRPPLIQRGPWRPVLGFFNSMRTASGTISPASIVGRVREDSKSRQPFAWISTRSRRDEHACST